jgi:2-amino-4-hydroxy-6-hydroxymethyldihydropteridine diphosphokinase
VRQGAVADTLVYVGLGANLGNTRATLADAIEALRSLPSVRALRVSPLYRSAPLDAGGPDFLNAVVELHTGLSPEALLDRLQAIERAHGRERPYRNAPRTLDLDLLLYGDQEIASERLTVPHPRMHERAFVLRPLAELAPGLEVPRRGSLRVLLERVAGQQADRLIDGTADKLPP